MGCAGRIRNGLAAGAEKPVDCWRISGAYDLTAATGGGADGIVPLPRRDGPQLDRPLFKVFNDQTLLAIASELPRKLDELRDLPGMSPNQVRRHGRRCCGQSKRACKRRRLTRCGSRARTSTSPRAGGAAHLAQEPGGLEIGVGSDVILPRDLMISLAENRPAHPGRAGRGDGGRSLAAGAFRRADFEAMISPALMESG